MLCFLGPMGCSVADLRVHRLCQLTFVFIDDDLVATKEGAAGRDSVGRGCSRYRTTEVLFGSRSGAIGSYGAASYSFLMPRSHHSQLRFEFTIESFGRTATGYLG